MKKTIADALNGIKTAKEASEALDLILKVIRDKSLKVTKCPDAIDDIRRIKGHADVGGVIALIWTADDIIDHAKDIGVRLSKKKANEILDTISRRHDCNEGVNWDVIDVHINF
jgi:hypothetical protein